jgi:hypothetical protein
MTKRTTIILTSTLLGFGILFLIFQNLDLVEEKPYYALDFEKVTMLADGSIQQGTRKFQVNFSGAGRAPALVHYDRYETNVLWFTMDPTPMDPDLHKDRSEVSLYSGVEFNKLYYVSFKFLLPINAETPENWNIITQCPQHQTGTPFMNYDVSPPLNLQISRDGSLNIQTLEDYTALKNKNFQFPWNRDEESVPISYGRWMNVILRFKMGPKGGYKLWLNHNLAIEKEIPIGFKDGGRMLPADEPDINKRVQGCTFKFGVYRGRSTKKFTILFDDYRIGPTYGSVQDP